MSLLFVTYLTNALFTIYFSEKKEKLDTNVSEVFWGCLLRLISHRDTYTHTHTHTHTLPQELEVQPDGKRETW